MKPLLYLIHFQDNLLAPPVYTRPANWEGNKVPEVLLSGNEKEINKWREEKSFYLTEKEKKKKNLKYLFFLFYKTYL